MKFYLRNPKRGLSLVELVVAIVVLSILASVAYVNYHRRRRVSEYKGSVAQIQTICAAERLYYLSFGVFWSTTSTANTNSRLGVKLQDVYFNNYRVTAAGGTFTVRVNAGNATYTFDANGQQTSCVGSDCV